MLGRWEGGRVGYAGVGAVVRGHDAAVCADGLVRDEPAWRRKWVLHADCGRAFNRVYTQAGVFWNSVRAEPGGSEVSGSDTDGCGAAGYSVCTGTGGAAADCDY